MTAELFDFDANVPRAVEPLAPGATVLRRFALDAAEELLAEVRRVAALAPFRRMATRAARRIAVGMTNCGALGWVSDESGYRYEPIDPESGAPWPRMPRTFMRLAADAAVEAGFAGFAPDACLINRYEAGMRLSLHQDRDERDFGQPIVSVSLGLPAVFLFGGRKRADPTRALRLEHGDVVVWGGPARLHYHGVRSVEAGTHPLVGASRINLTLRKAG